MTDQNPATRTEISARLMAVAEHTIVAEWICCEPLDPTHDLCAKGYATLEMTRALLVDDPEASVTAAPLLDAVMGMLPAAVPVSPPANQTASGSGRAAEAELYVLLRKAGEPRDEAQALIDRHRAEVLAVLPEQTDRAAVLRWAADRLTEDAAKGAKEGWTRIYQRAAATKLRIWAAEEQRTQTPACGPAPDTCDAEAGEPCANHERQAAHAEGEHCFCGPECEAAARPAVGEQSETQEADRG